jgi:nucleoid-associated protein YgaU
MFRHSAGRSRCVAVAAVGTAALWGVAAVLVRAATATQPATPDTALVRLCLVGLALVAAWAWLQAMAGVADAWRGAPVGTPRGVRRLALAACGVVLATALTGPAHADTDGSRPEPLARLPLPERAEGPARPHHDLVVVRRGDTLWKLAERTLPAWATDPEVVARWHDVYRRNRGVIGPDPDLIRPGQVLSLHQPTKETK